MKIYVAHYGDTLRKVADKHDMSLAELSRHNPHISNPDLLLEGKPINLPPLCLIEPQNRQKHWIPLTPLEQMAATEYDVLIVGSGAGGSSVLWRLCEQWRGTGRKIGIVEKGDLLLPTHAFNLPTMNEERFQQYFNDVHKPLGATLPDLPGAVQLFALGGRTLSGPRLVPAWRRMRWRDGLSP